MGAKQAFVLLISCFIHWMVWLDLVWSAVHFFQQSSRAFYWLRQTVTSQISYCVIRLFLVIKRKDQSRHKLSNGLIYPLQFKDISQYLLLWKEYPMIYEGIDYPLTRKDGSLNIEWRIQRKTSDFLQYMPHQSPIPEPYLINIKAILQSSD